MEISHISTTQRQVLRRVFRGSLRMQKDWVTLQTGSRSAKAAMCALKIRISTSSSMQQLLDRNINQDMGTQTRSLSKCHIVVAAFSSTPGHQPTMRALFEASKEARQLTIPYESTCKINPKCGVHFASPAELAP